MAYSEMAAHVPHNASDMYGSNLFNLFSEYYKPEKGSFDLDPSDEIVQGCVITRDGEVVNERIKAILSKGQ